MQEVIFTHDELRAKCAEWQQVLRLQDWTVDLNIKRGREFVTKDSNAEVGLNEQHKSAFIAIMDPVDYDPDQRRPQDMERDLVHELLHIHFWTLTRGNDDTNIEIAEEQAINMIAEGLIQLSRRGGEHKHEHNDLR